MLDLVKLSGQIPAFARHLQQESKANQERLRLALQEFARLQREPQTWQSRWAEWSSHLAFTCASPAEPPETWGSLPKVEPLQGPHTVVATDGSQILPSHHEIAYCSLINIGRVALHYGTQEWPLLDSQPLLIYGQEPFAQPERSNSLPGTALHPLRHRPSRSRRQAVGLGEEDRGEGGEIALDAEAVLALRRAQAELEELAQLALPLPRSRPVLALLDGSLIPWGLEPLPKPAQRPWLDPILATLEQLRAARIPLVGYISASRSSETLNYLRLGLCPYLGCDCYRYCAGEKTPPLPALCPPSRSRFLGIPAAAGRAQPPLAQWRQRLGDFWGTPHPLLLLECRRKPWGGIPAGDRPARVSRLGGSRRRVAAAGPGRSAKPGAKGLWLPHRPGGSPPSGRGAQRGSAALLRLDRAGADPRRPAPCSRLP